MLNNLNKLTSKGLTLKLKSEQSPKMEARSHFAIERERGTSQKPRQRVTVDSLHLKGQGKGELQTLSQKKTREEGNKDKKKLSRDL